MIVNILKWIIIPLIVCNHMVYGMGYTLTFPRFETIIEQTSTFDKHDIYSIIESDLILEISESTKIQSITVLMPTKESMNDTIFQNHGIFLEELKLKSTFLDGEISIGKLNPQFGMLWGDIPGTWGKQIMAEEYEIVEKIGFEYQHEVNIMGSNAQTFVSMFKADQSSLGKESFITNRENHDTITTQTPGLESYVMGLTGNREKLNYQIAYRYLAKGNTSYDDSGMLVSMKYQHIISNIAYIPVIEYVDIANMSGDSDRVIYTTYGIRIAANNWNAGISQTNKNVEGSNERQLQATIGIQLNSEIEGILAMNHMNRPDRTGLGWFLRLKLP